MIRHPQRPSWLAGLVVVAVTVAAPLRFGSVLPVERTLVEAALFVALAVAMLERRSWSRLRPVAPPAAALAAIGAFGFLQSVPWPHWAAGRLSAHGTALWDGARTLIGEAGGAVPLSVAPDVSRRSALGWLAVSAALAVAAVLSRWRAIRRLFAVGLAAVMLFEVVYGAQMWFERRGTIWGAEVPGDATRLRGTFVNPDHLALYLAVGLALCMACLWWSVRRSMWSVSLEVGLLLIAVPALVFLMLSVALAFTGSRAGLVVAAVAVGVQSALLVSHYRSWQMASIGLGAAALGGVGIALFGLQEGIGRLMETSAYEVTWNARLEAYGATLALARLFPWTGSGLGTFRQAFPEVQPEGLSGTWMHAHSDVLELLATAGPLGLLLLVWGTVALVQRLWTVFKRGRRSEERAAALAALGALAATAGHELVDFGLTIPANSLTLALLFGFAAGAPIRPARRSPEGARGSRPEPEGRSDSSRTDPG